MENESATFNQVEKKLQDAGSRVRSLYCRYYVRLIRVFPQLKEIYQTEKANDYTY